MRKTHAETGCGNSALNCDVVFQRMRQTNRMLVSMVVIFGSTWLPLNLINLLADLNLVQVAISQI
jgi:hypothetical protein